MGMSVSNGRRVVARLVRCLLEAIKEYVVVLVLHLEDKHGVREGTPNSRP